MRPPIYCMIPDGLARISRAVTPRSRWLSSSSPSHLPPGSFLGSFAGSFPSSPSFGHRPLVTLAIETSCDDTCVAVLERHPAGAAKLHFNERITSDNRPYGGVHPATAVLSHSASLAGLVRQAVDHIPRKTPAPPKPDLVAVTRGPGMLANLATGLATAKGLAVAWGVPLLGVNHMQAHALTPRLVAALEASPGGQRQHLQQPLRQPCEEPPPFPFLSLLVSGGHTMLLLSRSLCSHRILVPDAGNLAVGDMLDKCARDILPPDILAAAPDTMYAAALESFAFPDAPRKGDTNTNYDYDGYVPPARRRDEIRPLDVAGTTATLTPPLAGSRARVFNLTGFGTQVSRAAIADPHMPLPARRALARATMRLVFEHLASRVLFCLDGEGPGMMDGGDTTLREELAKVRTLVVSGGVASNRFLMRVLRTMLDVRGHGDVVITAPPAHLCTDNAAMIAWAAMEMWDAGWETDLSVVPVRKWSLDPAAADGGILGLPGWLRRE